MDAITLNISKVMTYKLTRNIKKRVLGRCSRRNFLNIIS